VNQPVFDRIFYQSEGAFKMSQPSQYQRVETVVHALVAKPLAVIVFGVWIGGRFIVRKTADYVARLQTPAKPTAGKTA